MLEICIEIIQQLSALYRLLIMTIIRRKHKLVDSSHINVILICLEKEEFVTV